MTDEHKTKDQLGAYARIDELAELRQRLTELEAERGHVRGALEPSQQQEEVAALLEGCRAVLQYREFPIVARRLFDFCKGLLGASGGYVSLLSKDGANNEALFVDSGELPCTVDPSLPMPIRGLRAQACRTGRAVYENEFAGTEWVGLLPAGHATVENVLFVPLVLDGKVVGLLGLANKPNGFGERDVRLASAFAELAAIALTNSRTLESLEASEAHFRALAQATSEGIAIHEKGVILDVNEVLARMFRCEQGDLIGAHGMQLVTPHCRDLLASILSTGYEGSYEIELARWDGSTFPAEISVQGADYGGREVKVATVRDVTEQ